MFGLSCELQCTSRHTSVQGQIGISLFRALQICQQMGHWDLSCTPPPLLIFGPISLSSLLLYPALSLFLCLHLSEWFALQFIAGSGAFVRYLFGLLAVVAL